jgi:hypothetical protein
MFGMSGTVLQTHNQHTTQAEQNNDSGHVMHIKELYFRQQRREKQIQEVQQFSKKY